MVQHAVDKIILQDKNELSAEDESHCNIYSEINEEDLYDTDNTSLDKNTEWHKREFESELENTCDIKNQNGITCKNENKANKIS